VRLALIGAPGSGKGTQGVVLAERLGVPHVSTGELLRDDVARGTALGRRIAAGLDRGELVPDDLMVEVVQERLAAIRGAGGYVLDGFPRTLAAERLLPGGVADVVVFLALPDEVAWKRLEHRSTQSGRSDDADGATIEHRLKVFHAETEPLLDYYREQGILRVVDADQAPERVLADIEAAIGSTGPGRAAPR
jgi:adenylate kinase